MGKGRQKIACVELVKKDISIKKIKEYEFKLNRMEEKNTRDQP